MSEGGSIFRHCLPIVRRLLHWLALFQLDWLLRSFGCASGVGRALCPMRNAAQLRLDWIIDRRLQNASSS